ncbi:dynactin subunit 2 [Dermatophagoides pteronyssinus]|uniref:Dynactin subunit 2 n=2 Tax=Dermatophagoides pteronyssinus TaxID=6956 RepID=A0ABQ8J7X9_DERPT|nr:dynactin subunit 2-B-like [Dermatophagoides pteronyssinus]KAH9418681.1 Dynactin subunit 2 [Dermatophagoides pteronyssinus]
MSSTSKYANLPFIASGEPDVYETDDLPEADRIQQQQQQPIQDASIEIIPSNSVDAFNKFAVADSHQSLSESTNKSESNVSLVEKYKQIKAEIEDLKHSIQSNEKSQSDGDSLPKDIENLFTNLSNLHDVCFKKLDTSQLVKDIGRVSLDNTGNNEPIIYELYQKPDKEEILELARINALEQRMKKIESTLGLNETIKDSSHPLLNNYLNDQSIMDIVINLSNKIVQLDYSSLDRMDARLQLIIDKLNQIQDKKSTLTELDKEDKLNEIYNHYVKIDQNRPLLPNILERLQVLNDLQDHASRFSNTMTAMETMQNEIKTTLDNNNQNLKNLQEMFDKVTNIQHVVDDFQNRLDKIKKSSSQ